MYNAHREKRTLPGLSDDVSGFISVTWTRHTRQYRSIAAHLRTPNTKERFHAGFRNTNRIPFRPKHNRVEFTLRDALHTHAHERDYTLSYSRSSRDNHVPVRSVAPRVMTRRFEQRSKIEGIGPSQSFCENKIRLSSVRESSWCARQTPRALLVIVVQCRISPRA
jgi:hypothetical protein